MKKSSTSRSFLAVTIMVIYLMITVTNIFFLPRITWFTNGATSGKNFLFKRKSKAAMSAFDVQRLVKRPDRCTAPSHNSLIEEAIKAAVGSFVLLFFVPFILKLNFNPSRLTRLLNGNFLPTQLTLCTFRI